MECWCETCKPYSRPHVAWFQRLLTGSIGLRLDIVEVEMSGWCLSRRRQHTCFGEYVSIYSRLHSTRTTQPLSSFVANVPDTAYPAPGCSASRDSMVTAEGQPEIEGQDIRSTRWTASRGHKWRNTGR